MVNATDKKVQFSGQRSGHRSIYHVMDSEFCYIPFPDCFVNIIAQLAVGVNRDTWLAVLDAVLVSCI